MCKNIRAATKHVAPHLQKEKSRKLVAIERIRSPDCIRCNEPAREGRFVRIEAGHLATSKPHPSAALNCMLGPRALEEVEIVLRLSPDDPLNHFRWIRVPDAWAVRVEICEPEHHAGNVRDAGVASTKFEWRA